ncbi:MAG TPA: glycine zipper 2TM domain-containing protein [Steroidobacteraceae bacterium]|nr:glycine zipper 2TM domain-containing protein [Steroidobacteraceae bacterium]
MRMPAAALLMALSAAALADDPPPAADAPPDIEGPSTAPSELFVYAAHGQSDKQLDRDRYECHNWAVKQSGYNPSDPHLAPHQQVQVVAAPRPGRDTVAGAVSGAMVGAIIGAPHDTGEGAVVGAIAGGVLGAASESARKKEAKRIDDANNAAAQAERARLEKEASDYKRAISACLEGRGYTVK